MNSGRIEELQKQIEDLKSRWPAHSVSPGMLQQLDELEEELQTELEKAAQHGTRAETKGQRRSSFLRAAQSEHQRSRHSGVLPARQA